jgi:hypothetical protein
MSTRSVIAVATPTGWEGCYVHWDGYPTARGPLIADYLAEYGYAGYLELISSSPKGMSSFPDRETGFVVERYEDGSGGVITGCDATCASCDPLFIEWVYIVRPNGTVNVLSSKRSGQVGDGSFRHVSVYDGPIKGADWEKIYTRDVD